MTVSVKRVWFTRVVSQTPSGDIVSSPWMPITRINGKMWQLLTVESRGDRVLYRVNAHPKPFQRTE